MGSGTLALAAISGVLLSSLFARRQRKKAIVRRFWHNLRQTQESTESIRHGREFTAREDDIFISTYPKSGTTWMQQICHGLRTRGDMDFEEITCVVPWNITAQDCGQRMTDEHKALPRCFKTHDTFEEVPKGAKYIVVVRDPRDVLVSFHAFLCDWAKTDPAEFTLSDFSDVVFCGAGSRSGDYWNHLAGWLSQIDQPNVLLLFFEDLKKNLKECVKRVADFMEITDPEALAIATKQASFGFMRDHAHQFDDHFLANHLARRTGYCVDLTVGKVREGGGQVGGYKDVLTPRLLARLNERWQAIVAYRFPFSSYEALYRRYGLQL